MPALVAVRGPGKPAFEAAETPMARLLRAPRTLLLLSSLTLLSTACDHQRRHVLKEIDHDKDRQHERDREIAKDDERPYVAPVDLELDWALGNSLVPANERSEVLARVRVDAPDALDLPRPPARVVLVVDTSASMKGDAIEGAKRAAEELVDTLAEGDSFSLVVFHSRAEVLMEATIINEDSRAAAKAEIEKMQAWGTTDLAGGMRLALNQLAAQPVALVDGEAELVNLGNGVMAHGGPDPQVLERVVLLGDGVPNDDRPIASLTEQFAARGAEITALGYGLEYDETLLASLAERTHGHFAFVDEPDAVAALFKDEVLHIQRTVARDLGLAFGLGPDVELVEVVGHQVRWDSNSARYFVDLGSIAEGQSQELIVRLAVGPHSEGATVELSDLELAYADVYTGTGNRFERAFLSAAASADEQAIAEGEDPEIARLGARARTNAATLQVLQLARAGQTKQAKDLLQRAVDWAKQAAERLEDDKLVAQAEELAALAPELASLAPKPRPQPGKGQGSVGGGGPLRPEQSAHDGAFAPPPPSSPAAARRVRKAHSKAFNELH